MKKTRKRYSAANIAMEAIRGELTLSELAAKHGIHHTMIGGWKRQAMDGMASLFDGGEQASKAEAETKNRETAYQDRAIASGAGLFGEGFRSMSTGQRRLLIELAHQCLSIAAQCRLLSISRSSYYYVPVSQGEEALALMRVIDETFMDCPWYGSRQMARHLQRLGHAVGRRRVRRLMAQMGLVAIYQRPRTSDPQPGASDLSLSAAGHKDRATQSGVVPGRDLSADEARRPLPRCDHGLGHPQGAGLAIVQHRGRGLLRRGSGGRHGPLWQAGYLQYRSG